MVRLPGTPSTRKYNKLVISILINKQHMFQEKLKAKSQLVLKRLVACIYLWTALNKTTLFSIFKFKLPHRIISILNGWKTLTVSLKTCFSIVNFLQ